ncbi:CDP-alcohol phosphatidyltransferase family protein [Mucilaginibacter sp. UR6-1]|uniref:CDP-alcohol phosphatidyltransferase family protein n=1 Tax=Mucilaginibacter sp. UR6-1 TaxID=1435643 RepID=UPI001E3E3B67|nr:CDP-alcohol phosphatidyltransferase family protein [Mucilaginibacter sp. UR6-1]MCC8410065.1 CDP-alcohol phosphatidyltransferase family protein [Mucilaginibacter sp. UR6-1]
MLKKLPITLVYSRLVFAAAIILLALTQPLYFSTMIITLISVGLLSDIFDGIIARRLNVSTEKLRRLDSTIDQVFWLSVLASAYIIYPGFFKDNVVKLALLLGLEGCCYIICYIRFRKEVATHAIASKFWALTVFASLIQVIATGDAGFIFELCFYTGVITRLEIIAIILIIKQWTNDVPSVYHAVLLRNNKPVKRHKLFNG